MAHKQKGNISYRVATIGILHPTFQQDQLSYLWSSILPYLGDRNRAICEALAGQILEYNH